MADKPIIFSAPMVSAILREIERPGTGKTQTRRVINPQPFADGYYEGEIDCTSVPAQASNLSAFFRFGATAVGGGAVRTETWEPRYQPGDRLYVREAWRTLALHDAIAPRDLAKGMTRAYEADDEHLDGWGDNVAPFPVHSPGRLRQGMHMPRWASRITLIVTDVRVQRLQEISEADAIAEGVDECDEARGFIYADHRTAFRDLWDRLNASRGYGWDTNPWVACYSFKPLLANIDQIEERAAA